MNKNIIKGLSLLTILATLTGCKPIFGPINSESSNSGSNSLETSENSTLSSQDSVTSENKDTSTSESSSVEDHISSEEQNSSSEEEVPPIRPDGPTLNEHGLAINPQDGTILHAFNWHLNNIKDALPEIKKAGYSTVQTSPMQPQKDIYINGHWKGQWWKLYQPLGFKVATKDHSIGTKTDLINLCKEADKYGIKIIVDVVANHLANRNGGDVNPNIKEYEPEIYNNNLFHPFSIGETNDKTIQNVVQGHLSGLPDLKTEDERVQNAVSNLLKEYIDCGVDGFRFDAAKHIETPKDGTFASNFWPNVLSTAENYAESKGNKLFYYGEILKTPGNDRSFKDYTSMMSITDSKASDKFLDAVKNKDFNEIEDGNVFSKDMVASSSILWGESHDTFSNNNGTSKNVDQKTVNKAYAISASMNDAASLYFARPSNDSKLGETKTFNWKDKEISAVNKLHNEFIASEEYITSVDNVFVNIKQKDCKTGVILVNNNDDKNFSIMTGGLKDGIYTDQVSMKQVNVKNGVISGTFDTSDVAVIYAEPGEYLPSISVSNKGTDPISKPTEVTIKAKHADKAYYQIDDNERIEFKDSVKIIVGEKPTTKLTVTVIKDNKEISKTYTYTKIELNELDIVCNNIPSKYLDTKYKLAAWVWKDGENGRWVEGELSGSTFKFIKNPADTHFILVIFNKSAKFDWANKVYQTKDIPINEKQVFDMSNAGWK